MWDSRVAMGADLLGSPRASAGAAQSIAFSRVSGGRPRSFWLGRRRWNSALGTGALGGLMLLAAAFLTRELSATPLLRLEIGMVAALLGLGGAACLLWALNALMGRFVLDQRGLRLSAVMWGFAVEWQDLAAWEVRSRPRFLGGPGVRLWLRQALAPVTVPGEWLSSEDCNAIHALLQATVPELEGGKGAGPNNRAAMASGLA
jgi:hypothetical protein